MTRTREHQRARNAADRALDRIDAGEPGVALDFLCEGSTHPTVRRMARAALMLAGDMTPERVEIVKGWADD